MGHITELFYLEASLKNTSYLGPERFLCKAHGCFLSGRALKHSGLSVPYNWEIVALRGARICPRSESKAMAGLGDNPGL